MTFIVNGWIASLPLLVAITIARHIARGVPPRVMQATTVLLMMATVFVALAPHATPQTRATIAIPEAAAPQRNHVATVWVSIAVVLIARDVFGALRIRRERRTWRRVTLDAGEIYTAPSGTPMTVGLLKPVVFIPRRALEMAPECARAIVLHERDHARFRDPLINLTVRVLRILCWPVLPLLAFERLVREFAEEAADRAAVRAGHAIDYAESLAQVAEWSAPSPAAAIALTTGSLEARILRILRPARLSTASAAAAALVLVASVFTTFNAPAAVIAQSQAEVIRARIADAARQMLIVEAPPAEPATKPKRVRAKPRIVEPLPLRSSGVLADSFRPAAPPIVTTPSPPRGDRYAVRVVQRTDPPPVVIRNVIRIVN